MNYVQNNQNQKVKHSGLQQMTTTY